MLQRLALAREWETAVTREPPATQHLECIHSLLLKPVLALRVGQCHNNEIVLRQKQGFSCRERPGFGVLLNVVVCIMPVRVTMLRLKKRVLSYG